MGYCMQTELILLWGYRFPVLDYKFVQILTPTNNREVLHISPTLDTGWPVFQSNLLSSVFPFRLASFIKGRS